MPMTWIPRPLSVGDGIIGAEVEHSPEEEAELQRHRTTRATPETIVVAQQIAAESKQSIREAFGGRSMHQLWEEKQRKLQSAEATGEGLERGQS